MTFAIETESLTKRFVKSEGYRALFTPWRARPFTALDNVSLQVDEGSILGLIGPNGAGKTTLLKVLATLLLPNGGRASVKGHDVAKHPASVKRHVGYSLSDDRSFYFRLTGRQNLRFFGALSNVPRGVLDNRIGYLAERLQFSPFLDRRVHAYSSGTRQKLAIARALITEPSVLLLDEPTRSMDRAVSQTLRRFVQELVRERGVTTVIATHDPADLEELCERAAVMDHGRLVSVGDARGVMKQSLVERERGIVITVERKAQGLVELIGAGPGVREARWGEPGARPGSQTIEVTLDDALARLPEVIAEIDRQGIKVLDWATAAPSLDTRLEQLLGRGV